MKNATRWIERLLPNPLHVEKPSLRLARWSFCNALLMLLATAVFWATGSPRVLPLTGASSFLFLILVARAFWSEGGAFGPANAVTACRLAGVVAFGLFSQNIPVPLAVAWGLLLLAADGWDGWLARRFRTASEFGEYFDKETDAFFLLILCVLAVSMQRLGPWILIAGLLRYFFVVFIRFRPSVLKERKTARARIIYALMLTALLGSFLPYPALYGPLSVIATAALVWSFASDFRWGFAGNTMD